MRVWDYTKQRIHFQTDGNSTVKFDCDALPALIMHPTADFNTISVSKKIPLSRISSLEFFKQQIVAVGQNGVVVLWNLALKETNKVSAGW